MKVTIFQTDVIWACPDKNVRNVQHLFDENADSDLYVLPEMWATGFATEPHGIAENSDSIALRWMRETAVKHSCAISGSLLILDGDGKYRNRHYFVTPSGTFYYDKHHLFTYGHEDDYIMPGAEQIVVSWQGRRFLLLTCYDLRFPLWARYGMAGEYDAIIVVANWPEKRQQAWRVLTRARAVENQCFLIGVNRVGDDQFCHYCGESIVADFNGGSLLTCEPEKEEAKTVELDFSSLDHIRSRFRVLEDRDTNISFVRPDKA